MNNSLARLDFTQIFCDINDFHHYQVLDSIGQLVPQLPSDTDAKP